MPTPTRRIDRAREYYEQGEKAHAEDWRFYQGLAGLAMKDKKYEDALAWVDKGIKAVPANEAQNLLFLKSELQFQANDIVGVRKTAEEMRNSGFRPEFIEWIEARIMLAQEKWFEASKALYNLQPKMAESGPYADMIAVQLGLAYEKSGRLDLAEDSYDVVLQHNPTNDPAKAGKQRVARCEAGLSKKIKPAIWTNRSPRFFSNPKRSATGRRSTQNFRNWRRIESSKVRRSIYSGPR